jgi:hypothetical protein
MTAVMIFSHPNHEVAVLGSLCRLKPHVIFLTDGGSAERVAQTRAGLAGYLPPENLTFLNHSEASLYEALLNSETAFYETLAAEVAAVLKKLNPETVYCDMVEFYNPVHDMAMPVTRRALQGSAAKLMEVPLVYQKAGSGNFELQHVPDSLAQNSVIVELSREELARKTATIKGGIYGMLFNQMGGLIVGAVPAQAGREQFLKARQTCPKPAPEQALRYDARGKALKDAGQVSRAISYADHYVPMFESLCGTQALAA